MNLRTILSFLLLLPCCITAQEKTRGVHFNAGIKAGFQAVTYNDPEFGIEGYIFDENNIQSNKIGYTISPFLRITRNSFYIQVESIFGITNHSFDFKDTEQNSDGVTARNSTTYTLKTYCMQVPLLFGYNFVDQKRFGMSVFTGPKTKFTFTAHNEQEFKHFKHAGMKEILKKRCYYWEIGLGVKIANVFFDFVYDAGLTDTSEYIITEENKKFKSSRRDNILSFSVGMIF